MLIVEYNRDASYVCYETEHLFVLIVLIHWKTVLVKYETPFAQSQNNLESVDWIYLYTQQLWVSFP